MNITLSLEQYEALCGLARKGATTANSTRDLDVFLRDIEKANNVCRRFLWVQWQEANSPLPPTAVFPDKWPPELRQSIERMDRAITRSDVEYVLKACAVKPVCILVTTDLGATIGWTPLEEYFKA